MSKLSSTDYTCRSCKTVSKQRLWDSVNVTLDPSLRERALSGDIFRLTCPACGEGVHAQYDCLYHDMQKTFMVQLTHEDRVGEVSVALAEAAKQMTMREQYRMRIVTSFHDMVEKIFVLEAGLSDGIVEIIKVLLPAEDPAMRDAQLRFQAVTDEGELAFAIVRASEKPKYAVLPRALYDDLKDKAFEDMFAHTDARGQWLSVDGDAVQKFFASRDQRRAPET
jgi:hypothetical protein